MSKTVARPSDRGRGWQAEAFTLYTPNGARKYLNRSERGRVLEAMAALDPGQALFALTLAWTGARVSEVLALTPASLQVETGIVAIRTLKRRRHCVREVPIPSEVMRQLDRHFRVSATRRDPRCADHRLWPWHRVTAWRLIKQVMSDCRIFGAQATPRGLRHSFAVGALQAGVPLNLVQRWLGHARISTTAIYAAASGPEERAFAAQFWRCSAASGAIHMGI